MLPSTEIQALIERDVPSKFRVPGGAIAVVKSGEVIAKHAWGYANLDTRSPVEPTSVFPICSISKQMVCLILTQLLTEDPSFETSINTALKSLLPSHLTSNLEFTIPRIVGNQSGLRDYWALSVLWGATPQDRFSVYSDAPEALKRLGKFHFHPGTQFSYSNTNFMLIGLAIEKATGKSLSNLLQERLFTPAGMTTAALRVDTAKIPSPMVGYEGSETMGYIPYNNCIEWAGDAGVQASLEDMIAYEKFVHKNAKDSSTAYYRNTTHPTYSDGRAANYGQGLVFGDIDGEKLIGHSGGLAGFRLRRVYAPDHDLSVMVLLNSHTDTKLVVDHCFRKLLGTSPEQSAHTGQDINIRWTGNYLDEEAKIAVVVTQDKPGKIVVNYAGHDETLTVVAENEARCKEMKITVEGDVLNIVRVMDGRTFTAKKMKDMKIDEDAKEFVGEYYSEDVDSRFHVVGDGSMLYGAFDGYLGKGPMHVMRRIGEDVWWLACYRSLDAPAPGNWTVAFSKDRQSVSVGCWLARNVKYKKVQV